MLNNNNSSTTPNAAIEVLRAHRLCTYTDSDDEIVYADASSVAKAMNTYGRKCIEDYRKELWISEGVPDDLEKLQHLAVTTMKKENLACSILMIRAFVLGLRLAAELAAM